MKNILFFVLLSLSTTAVSAFQSSTVHKIDDYKLLVGKWEGSGFMTDNYGLRQEVSTSQWVDIKDKVVVIEGQFKSDATGFTTNFVKQFYYNSPTRVWLMKVYMEKKYFITTPLSLSDNYTLIYTFKDDKGLMNRATIYAAFPYGWTEMLETWTGQTWDMKRRIIMRKIPNVPTVVEKRTATKIVKKSAYKPPF